VKKDVRIHGYFSKPNGSASKKFWETLEIGYGLDNPGSNTQQQREFYVFSKSSKLAVGCDKPLQWVMVAEFMEVQWLGCEADYSSASSAEVKKELNCTTPAVGLHGVYTDSLTTST
jgi:hypothetical protein